MLQEAADFAIEYINAVLGEGKEYFGLKVGQMLILYDEINKICLIARSFCPDRLVCLSADLNNGMMH